MAAMTAATQTPLSDEEPPQQPSEGQAEFPDRATATSPAFQAFLCSKLSRADGTPTHLARCALYSLLLRLPALHCPLPLEI